MAYQAGAYRRSNWTCSDCFSLNTNTDRQTTPCNVCGMIDSDKNRTKANGFYLFGIIKQPLICFIPPDTPFFIYPLDVPKVTYITEETKDALIIRCVVSLFDAKRTTNYHVSKIKFQIQSSSNGYHLGNEQIIHHKFFAKPGEFDIHLDAPYHGSFVVSISAIIEYRIGFINYSKISLPSTFCMHIKRSTPLTFHHELKLENYIISQAEFKENDADDSNYYKPQLIKLCPDNDDECLSVYVQFLESAHLQMSEIENIFVYKIANKHLEDAYKSKQKQMLRILDGDESKLNEKVLYHGTNLDVILKILHQGKVRLHCW